ncbi:MAG: hypothetical protein ACOYVJ_10980 [Nitrospirota bacterium]
MNKPPVRFLIASPCGDIPVNEEKLDLPLETDPLKTSYREYFRSITDFLTGKNSLPLHHALNITAVAGIYPHDIDEIIIRTEKHGALYHPASIDLVCKTNRIKFGLNVAVTDAGKDCLRREFTLLKVLHETFNLPFIPEPYFLGELDSKVFLLEEWFEGYHEFHIAETGGGRYQVKLWEYGKGDRFLSPAQSFALCRQAAMILTLYYDIDNFRVIYPWHHAAGDFIAKITDEEITDVRLTTVRGYEPFLSTDEDLVHPALALFYFLLHLSIQMRLDKLDGVGEIAWADAPCIEATLAGFFQALEMKKDFMNSLGSTRSFLELLKSFSRDDLEHTFRAVAAQFEQTKDFPVIARNLAEHVSRFYLTLRNFP